MRGGAARITKVFHESRPMRGNSVVLVTYQTSSLNLTVKLIKVEILHITFNNNNNNNNNNTLNGEYKSKVGPKLSGPLGDPDYLWFPKRKLCMYVCMYACGEIKTGFNPALVP
jgi:hypothetical protein